MRASPLSISTGARGRGVCLRLVVAVFVIMVFPAPSRALDARLRWTASSDSRVQGYSVYVREATTAYGTARDAGAPARQADGSVAWTLTGLSPTAVYFVAVTARTTTGLESALSNELPIGTPNSCVSDTCTSRTQCSVQRLPDGSPCGPPGATCGATCLAGVCAGLADRVLTLKRVRVSRSADALRILARGTFITSASFDPLDAGLALTITDPSGGTLARATLAPADLIGTESVVKTVRRRNDMGPVSIRGLLLRSHDGETRWKARLIVSPPPAVLPASASVALESGAVCFSATATDCASRTRSLTCR